MTHDEFVAESTIRDEINILSQDLNTVGKPAYHPFWTNITELEILKDDCWHNPLNLNSELENEVSVLKTSLVDSLKIETQRLKDLLQYDDDTFNTAKSLVTGLETLKCKMNTTSIGSMDIHKSRLLIKSDIAKFVLSKYQEDIEEPIKKIIENKIIELETELEKL